MVPTFVVGRVASLIVISLCLLLAAPAFAQGAEQSPQTAVRLAKASFEYRDFKKVVELLDPWLHPPRIVDPKLEVQARELMGVSQHVLGQVDAAEEEFAQLLKLHPKHELDPFLVPPPVVQSFEEVRAKMKPILDKLLGEPAKPEPAKVKIQTELRFVQVPHRAVVFMPLGIPQFALDEPVWGAVWAGLQVVGLAANIAGWRQGRAVRTANSSAAEGQASATAPWLGLQYFGAGLVAGAWAGSSIQGWAQLQTLRRSLEVGPQTSPTAGATLLHWQGTF